MGQQAFKYNLSELQEICCERIANKAFKKAAREIARPLVLKLTMAACSFLGLAGTFGVAAYYTMPSGDPFFTFAAGAALELAVVSFSASQIYHFDPPAYVRQFDIYGNVKETAKGFPHEALLAANYALNDYCSPCHPPKNDPVIPG